MTAEPGREYRNRPASPARTRPPDMHAGAFIRDVAIDDRRFYVPLSPAAGTRPLWISPGQNRWCEVLMVVRAGLVNRHRHQGQVFAYTISGRWGFLEHDWVATAGDWVYAAPGSPHTLVVYEHPGPTRVTSTVTGPLVWLDEDGDGTGHFDAFDYLALCRNHYARVGIGADYIESLIR